MFSVKTETERITLGEGDVFLKLCLPVLKAEGAPLEKNFNAYYEAMQRGFMSYSEDSLAPAAAKRQGAPYGAALNTVLCFESGAVLSLYTDIALNDGKGSRQKRIAALWHKPTGTLINPKRLFKKDAKKPLLCLLLEELKKKSKSTSLPLYADGGTRLKRKFDWESFYLSPAGCVFFYGGGVLCEGAKPFALPLDKEAVWDLLAEGQGALLWEE